MKKSRAKEKILGKREENTAHPIMGNVQQTGGQ